MDFEECVLGRRSIRKFRPGKVPDELIKHALELANAAPSAGNLQAREFIVVRDPSRKQQLSQAALGQSATTHADVDIVFCANLKRIADYGKRGAELYVLQDTAAAIENFILYIHSQGLGTVWIGAFNEDAVSKALELPPHIRPLAIVPVGVPGEAPVPSRKRPIDDMTHKEKWPG